MQSIPLIIPTVMNPSLSPNSSSGVSLQSGREILYRYKGNTTVSRSCRSNSSGFAAILRYQASPLLLFDRLRDRGHAYDCRPA